MNDEFREFAENFPLVFADIAPGSEAYVRRVRERLIVGLGYLEKIAQEREAKLQAEIERLENDLAATRILYDVGNKDNAIDGALKDIAHFEAENAKLRAEIERLKKIEEVWNTPPLKTEWQKREDEIAKLRGAVERLRHRTVHAEACSGFEWGDEDSAPCSCGLKELLSESADALGGK